MTMTPSTLTVLHARQHRSDLRAMRRPDRRRPRWSRTTFPAGRNVSD